MIAAREFADKVRALQVVHDWNAPGPVVAGDVVTCPGYWDGSVLWGPIMWFLHSGGYFCYRPWRGGDNFRTEGTFDDPYEATKWGLSDAD